MSGHTVRQLAPAFAVTIFMIAPGPALAGWHARLSLTSPGQPPAVSHIYYEAGKVRLERSEGSLIIDLATGVITTFSHDATAYMQTSIAELAAIRDEMRRQMPAGGQPALPPSDNPIPKASGRSLKVGRFACDVYTWKTARAEGEVCLSRNIGIDLGGFHGDMASFAEKLRQVEGAQVASAIFDLTHGAFPVRSWQKIYLGGRVLEKRLIAIERTTVPDDLFLPPTGYIKKNLTP